MRSHGELELNLTVMDKKDLRIVFMGTPSFAVASLRCLVERKYNVVGVVTASDKPVGRHRSTAVAPEVKNYALSVGIPVLQPENLKDPSFLATLRSWQAGIQAVVAFRMLPEEVWAMPPLGTLNVHASLLPQYRGAAPINWAVINGESESGVTTFFLRSGMDTGDVALQKRIPVYEDDTAGDLHDRLMEEGARLLADTIDSVMDGSLKPVPQSQLQCGGGLRGAPKIHTETCRIDFARSLGEVYNFIRGLAPSPAAWTEVSDGLHTYTLKIFRAAKRPAEHGLPPGVILPEPGGTLSVTVGGGYIDILEMQLSGRRRMTAGEFLRGFRNAGNLRITDACQTAHPASNLPARHSGVSPDGELRLT